MPILITALVPGQTEQGYDATMAALRPLLEKESGFIAHGAGMSPEGWRVFEVWESQDAATAFFAKHIRPNLPPGITPKRNYLELYSLVVQGRV